MYLVLIHYQLQKFQTLSYNHILAHFRDKMITDLKTIFLEK